MLINYFTSHFLEITGFIFGVLYVIGAIKEKVWCWPAGLVAITTYGVSSYQMGLYGEFSLQFLYFFITLYGWMKWKSSKSDFVSKSSSKTLYILLVSGVILSILFYFLLDFLGGSNPFWDAITNGFSLIATYLVARKKIENWILWIPIDLTVSALMFYKGYYFYMSLYIVYTLFAVYGYFEWKKRLE